MIVVVRWLIIGLRHHINFGAPKARSSVHMTTNMQVKRLRLSARRAPCPEPWGRTLFDFTDGWGGRHPFDVPVVVVTHHVPTEWVDTHPPAPYSFATGVVAAALI